MTQFAQLSQVYVTCSVHRQTDRRDDQQFCTIFSQVTRTQADMQASIVTQTYTEASHNSHSKFTIQLLYTAINVRTLKTVYTLKPRKLRQNKYWTYKNCTIDRTRERYWQLITKWLFTKQTINTWSTYRYTETYRHTDICKYIERYIE